MSPKRLILFIILLSPYLFFPNEEVKAISASPTDRTTHFIDSRGWYHVWGEVYNTAPTDQNGTVQVTTTFTGEGSQFIASLTTNTLLDPVRKGENASFHVILANATKSALVTDYTFAVNFVQVANNPQRLSVTQTSNSTDNGNLRIQGTVTNNMSVNATFIEVIATFKGGPGNNTVIYADWVYPDSLNLTVGSSSTFVIQAVNSTNIRKTYLTAQCSQYVKTTVSDFTLRVVPPLEQSVAQGSSVTYGIRTIPVNSSYEPFLVTFSVFGLPTGATASFTPTTSPFVGTPVNLTITTTSAFGVGLGDFLITISSSGAEGSHAVRVLLSVSATTDFSLLISPSTRSVSQDNQQATYTITAKSSGGFSSPVTLNYSNIPTGSTANFSVNPITPTVTGATSSFKIYTNIGTPIGTKTVTICGSGGSPLISHCTTASVTVTQSTAPSFSLSISPTERTLQPDSFTEFVVGVDSINNFNSPVSLNLMNAPAGTTGSFSLSSVKPPSNGHNQSTLTITASSMPSNGTFTITVKGISSGLTKTKNATLIINQFVNVDFAVYLLPATLSIIQNNSGTATIQVVSINNFDGTVDLMLQNRPTGVTYSIANPTVAPLPGGYLYTKLTVQTSSSTPLGDYTMNLIGTSGGKTHSLDLGLTVTNKSERALPLPKCIIATATYGSEFTPEVQFLRSFRENRVLSTAAGSEFMKVFNAWYYSFSPYVASWVAQSPIIQEPAKLLLLPLLGILHISEISYSSLSFSPEVAVTFAGVVASSLIGIIYFGPILTIASRKHEVKNMRRVISWTILIWTFSILLLTIGLLTSILPIVMITSSLLVLSTITLGSCAVPLAISRIKLMF